MKAKKCIKYFNSKLFTFLHSTFLYISGACSLKDPGGCTPLEPINIEPSANNGNAATSALVPSSGSKKKKNPEDCDLGYITQLDKDGNIQQIPITFEGDADSEPNPMADFMAGKFKIPYSFG